MIDLALLPVVLHCILVHELHQILKGLVRGLLLLHAGVVSGALAFWRLVPLHAAAAHGLRILGQSRLRPIRFFFDHVAGVLEGYRCV